MLSSYQLLYQELKEYLPLQCILTKQQKQTVIEMPFYDTDSFEVYLKELSKQDTYYKKVLLLGNELFYKAKGQVIPDYITKCFIPLYSTELNLAK